jgi:serine protease AprX
MSAFMVIRRFALFGVLILVLGSGASVWRPQLQVATPDPAQGAAFIVQAPSAEAAAAAVVRVGGTVTRRLALINGVSATLDLAARRRLQADRQVVLHADTIVRTTSAVQPEAHFLASDHALGGSLETGTAGYVLYPAAATGAYLLHHQSVPTYTSSCQNQHVTVTSQQAPQPLEGRGVTVAVIDSGLMKMRNQSVWQATGDGALFASNGDRCIIYRDFLPRSPFYDNQTGTNSTDQNGHGTHVISTIADNRQAQLTAGSSPSPVGVAPQVNLMIARVLDADGAGTYSDVIDAIGWIIANKATYNVRVLNLSLYTPVTGPYWIDPLGQAVMQAWKAGITVVVAAGNAGPEAGTITVPGNVPYVITAGAIKSGRLVSRARDTRGAHSRSGRRRLWDWRAVAGAYLLSAERHVDGRSRG